MHSNEHAYELAETHLEALLACQTYESVKMAIFSNELSCSISPMCLCYHTHGDIIVINHNVVHIAFQ